MACPQVALSVTLHRARPPIGGWSVPMKSARFCVAALEAGLAEILAWERAASMSSAGIAL